MIPVRRLNHAETLRRLGSLVGASDHGVSKSPYGKDPDGNEFEVLWTVPREGQKSGSVHQG
jgi:catechol-2,3-dioxygenase